MGLWRENLIGRTLRLQDFLPERFLKYLKTMHEPRRTDSERYFVGWFQSKNSKKLRTELNKRRGNNNNNCVN